MTTPHACMDAEAELKQVNRELIHALRHLAAICDARDENPNEATGRVLVQIHAASAYVLAFEEANKDTCGCACHVYTGTVLCDCANECPAPSEPTVEKG